jgi:hypothetical protein
VWDKIISDLDGWAVLIHVIDDHQKGKGAYTSACLSDDCQLGSTDKQSGSHTRRCRGCMVESTAALRFSWSPVFAPVFSLSIGLTSQVHISTLHRQP